MSNYLSGGLFDYETSCIIREQNRDSLTQLYCLGLLHVQNVVLYAKQ